MASTTVHRVQADGVNVFYRSAGPSNAPVILLLHGYPASSFMYRNLIPLLSQKYRVIAPDLPGFGFTEVPDERGYKYTFANLGKTIEAFLDALSIQRYAVYIFDYGAPTAWHLALRRPSSIMAIITQNGNGYEEGLGAEFWAPLQTLWKLTPGSAEDRSQRQTIEEAVLNFSATKFQYTNGSPRPDAVPPETYHLDAALLERPGNHAIQLDLFRDYGTNLALYPKVHDYLASSGVPVLAVWGKNDIIFPPAGAEAYRQHVGDIEIHYLDGPHFALETNEEETAGLILAFLAKRNVS